MMDHWEITDVYKALLAVAAGMILGLERELKDKVAGLKTITIICLGAALFGILSYKVGGNHPTTIAAYVVSGVGFIGAGAIFKDGFSVSGLTTAGIIWLAAAVGLAIGFGEFYMAATFIGASLVIIFITPFINSLFRSKKITRQLEISALKQDIAPVRLFLQSLQEGNVTVIEKKMSVENDIVKISVELVLKESKIKWVEEKLLSQIQLRSFDF